MINLFLNGTTKRMFRMPQFSLKNMKNFSLFKLNFKSAFCFSTINSEERELSENKFEKDEEIQLRQIQTHPKYEASIGFAVAGDYDRAYKSLSDLKNQLKLDRQEYNEDYIFLLKKMGTINKVNRNSSANIELLSEIIQICNKLYKSNFNYLFENYEYVIINLNHIDPSKAIEFIKEAMDSGYFPTIFEPIFKYYLGSSYILEGKSMNRAIQILESLDDQIEDNYLLACVLNNRACAVWWEKTVKHIKDLENNSDNSYELILSFTKDISSAIKQFKQAVALNEEIQNYKYEDRIKYAPVDKNNFEEFRVNVMNYILSASFDYDQKLDINFIKQVGETKSSFTNMKTSAVIFSNLGELYYNIREFKKSLVCLNIANLFYHNNLKNDIMFYKNLALVSMNNFKLTKDFQVPKQLFEKILNQIKPCTNNYEKVFIFRQYGELLLEENKESVLGINLVSEANKMESNLPNFECRRLYLTLPSDV